MNFVEPLFQGFVTGIGLSLMLGTVFFSIIQNSVSMGYKYGILISVGVILSDIMFISLALWSSTFAVFLEAYSIQMTWVGASLLMLFGASQFFKKDMEESKSKVFKSSISGKFYFVGNGFFLNVINPVNFFVWLSISTMLGISLGYSMTEKVYFFVGALLAIFTTETLLAVFASRIRKWMNNKRLKWVNRISGTVFILIAVYLVVESFM